MRDTAADLIQSVHVDAQMNFNFSTLAKHDEEYSKGKIGELQFGTRVCDGCPQISYDGFSRRGIRGIRSRNLDNRPCLLVLRVQLSQSQ